MSAYVLHNPASQAHLEDLKGRLTQSLAGLGSRLNGVVATDARIETVVQAVQAMGNGVLSLEDVWAVLSSLYLPGFSIDRWATEMIEESV